MDEQNDAITNNGAPAPLPTPPKKKKGARYTSLEITLSAAVAAILIIAKYMFSWLYGFELVTLLVIIFTCSFSPKTVFIAVNVFCALDPVIYPMTMSFPSIIVSYFIYWNLLAGITYIFYKLGLRNPFVYAIEAFFMTFLFGLLTTAAQCIMTGTMNITAFWLLYSTGMLMYVIYMAGNAVVVGFSFNILTKTLRKLNDRFCNL